MRCECVLGRQLLVRRFQAFLKVIANGVPVPASHYANASINTLASCRSAVSNPSVNQP
jgi:hypothetical protein